MKMRSFAAFVLGCTVSALASGCAGSSNGTASLPSLNEPASAGRLSAGKDRVRFVIRLPHKKHKGRLPRYLSLGTKSMRVVVTLGGAKKLNKVVSLTLNSAGCKSSALNAQCEFDVALAPANGYIASFTTYDGVNGSGNLLSAAVNTVFDVFKGQTSVVGITLDAVPTKLETFSAGTNLFYAITLDPDGNMIVGPGAPVITATSRGTTVATVTQPTAAQPNTIRVTPIAGKFGAQTIDLKAGYPLGSTDGCEVSTAVCSFPGVATAVQGQIVFVANYYDYAAQPVFGFPVPLTSSADSPAFSFNADYPGALKLDSHQDVLIPQYSAGSLLVYAPPYNALTRSASGSYYAYNLAVAADDTAFVAEDGYVGVYASPYTSAAIQFTSGVSNSYGIAVDSSDDIYVTGKLAMSVFKPPYTSSSTAAHTATLASTAEYGTLISGNKLYVGESSGVEVFSLPITTNNPTALMTISSGISQAFNMIMDAHGNLYVANYNGGSSTEGSITIYNAPITNGESPSATIQVQYYPQEMVFDKAGNLYVSTYEGGANDEGSLQEFKPPFTNSSTPAFTESTGFYYPYQNGLAITPGGFEFYLNQ